MTFIQGNEISNARDTTHERPTHEEAEFLDDVECNHYKIKVAKNKDDTTTQYKRHLDDCVKDHVSLKGQGNLFLPLQAPRSNSASGIQTRKYDQAKIREVVSHMIMVHELPFAFTEYELFTLLMKIASPHYVRISHATAKADCWTSYEVEKKRLNGLLKIVDRISITTDMWKLGQKIQYIVLTAHFVDSDWNLQKKVLNFVDMPPLHSGVFAYDAFCCAHILNLLVHDGLFEIEDVIDNDVFPQYAQCDASYKYLPSDKDWVRVEEVRSFLTLFNEVTNIISSSEYPTSNLFLLELWSIKELLMEKSLSEELWMKQMTDKMQRKFDKYWGECNLLISITAILDPRNKMKLINFSFCVIYFEEKAPRKICIVRGSLYEIYKEYVNEYATTNVGTLMENDMQESAVSNASTISKIDKGKVMTGRSRFVRVLTQLTMLSLN
ncbi:zinc finger BED domain-containing protein RICESLEEPER 2-like [Gossypium arboreum]|uniref:zinc finger BED domain-containing protein RICESLEEPER 2-like n=1 Tax=Gossypium arboreum TaxID=29729 RepID=UPI000819145B|nr:zinc finger BED domain-containing protein RICESLEEPER 2-like [Gossypium arboreum]